MATKVKLIADGVITPDQITLTTASTGTNTTAPATTAFVQQEISALVDSSPDALNTLNELAAALGDDANFSTTVTNSIATKAPLASPTFTGTLTASGLAYPTSDGTNGQVLTTDGSGTLSFSTISGYTDSDVETYLNTSEIYTDPTNNRLGIGTNNPGADLHISLVNAKIKLGSYSFITEDIEDNDSLGLWTHTTESIYFGQTSDNLTSRNITCRIDPDGILRPTRFRVPASALPTSAVSTGDMHIDTGDSNTLKVYNGTQWIEISSTSVQASGGTTTTYGGYKSHTFTSSGTFTVTAGGSIDVMLVAGGGGGSQDTAGGGGAGGMLVSQSINVVAQSYTITIGAGGAQANGSRGYDGNDTTAFGLTAIAGGGGAGSAGGTAPAGNGGSGGGGGGGRAAGSGTAGQGFAGETSSGAAGGGGAGEAGGTDGVGYGGDGLQNNYRTGSNTYYAGGGGGRAGSTGYPGGDGGGGNGPSGNSGLGAGNAAYAGTANTGGGGAAYSGAWNGAGPGGSGIVVIRYPA